MIGSMIVCAPTVHPYSSSSSSHRMTQPSTSLPKSRPSPKPPLVDTPNHPVPHVDMKTTRPTAVNLDISLRRSRFSYVSTPQGEKFLTVQKLYVKPPGVHTRRTQFRVFSAAGQELLITHNKKRLWVFTWPKSPGKEMIINPKKPSEVISSNPNMESFKMRYEKKGVLILAGQALITSKETGRVLATDRGKGLMKYLPGVKHPGKKRNSVMTMDQGADVALMVGVRVCQAQIESRTRSGGNGGPGAP